MADNRFRVWGTIAYPESCSDDFIEILKSYHIEFLVSPLHDKDFNSDGSLKKAHYHILFNFEGKQSYDFVKSICDSIGAVRPERIISYKKMARYHCHLDDKDKAQYNINDEFGYMADYIEIISQESDEWNLIDEIIEFIDCNCMTNFVDLVNYARENNKEWFRYIVSKRTYFIKEYQKSLSYKLKI